MRIDIHVRQTMRDRLVDVSTEWLLGRQRRRRRSSIGASRGHRAFRPHDARAGARGAASTEAATSLRWAMATRSST